MGDKDVSAKIGQGMGNWKEQEVCNGSELTLSPHCVWVITKEPACKDTQDCFWHHLLSHIASCSILFLVCRNIDGHKDGHCRAGMDGQSCLWGEYHSSILTPAGELRSIRWLGGAGLS